MIMVYLTDPRGGSCLLNYIKNKLNYLIYNWKKSDGVEKCVEVGPTDLKLVTVKLTNHSAHKNFLESYS